ncbi:MAG: hypothetical protein COA39_010055 [Sulfurimonas sp.]|nr:hypothetical protein [Sulfurimonas sp.]
MIKLVIAFCILLMNVSSIHAKDISTYLIGEYVDVASAKEKLLKAGFEVIAEYKSVKDGITIIFTNEALKLEASKPKRANAAILRLFIDNKEKMISFTNPIYFGKAFMQDEYNAKVYEEALASISSSFTSLKDSVDKLDEDDIEAYHFMIGMPYYEDVDELGKDSTSELLVKVQNYKKGKFVLFTLKLSNDSYLVGYDLSKRTKKFVKKIGRANGAVLPYVISIENGLASSLEAKYYLAVSYPLLTMTEFTTIATIPGAIKKDLSKPFK